MTARSIIAKGCIHLPRPADQPVRPLAAAVRVVRAGPTGHRCAPAEGEPRPHASTTVMRWSSTTS